MHTLSISVLLFVLAGTACTDGTLFSKLAYWSTFLAELSCPQTPEPRTENPRKWVMTGGLESVTFATKNKTLSTCLFHRFDDDQGFRGNCANNGCGRRLNALTEVSSQLSALDIGVQICVTPVSHLFRSEEHGPHRIIRRCMRPRIWCPQQSCRQLSARTIVKSSGRLCYYLHSKREWDVRIATGRGK